KARERVQHVAKRFGVAHTSVEQLQAWRADTARTTFLLDVRSAEEFSRAHWAGAQHAAGGQLVQATDEYVGVRNARIVLCDSPDGVRATMTASWLVQLGYRDVYVLVDSPEVPETGEDVREPALFVPFPTITVAKLRELLKGEADTTAVIDLASSPRFRRGHIPGAHWAVRARLAAWGPGLPVGGHIVLTSPDGLLAHYVAHELSTVRPDVEVQVLDGGTSGWVAAGEELESGLKRVLTETDDVWWKPYESQGGVKQAMEDYLTWEVGLVEQIERDRLVTFRAFD
ncbi:MAG TPA: rhodanese-like domain-containing protein, partial [Hyphomicrobiaceae bacterium]|nr:rhodanese-like domain-containing protein [Hyphomicrobiaceae bacterium]